MTLSTELVLCLDVGNTNVAVGLYAKESLVQHWRLSTDTERTADEYGIALRSLLSSAEVPAENIRRTVLSSVVPSLTAGFVTLVETVLNKTPLVVKRTLDIGLEFAIENPAELGTDLIANAVAGYNRCRSNCIVVDFGTALSFTVVDQARRIRGASIAPGMQAAMNALSRNTDQLPHVPLVAPPSAIGTNTIHAIQSGIIFGYVGLVGAIIDRIRGELDGPATVIATGGLSGVIATLIDSVDSVEPWLTLEGLRLIGERNPERA